MKQDDDKVSKTALILAVVGAVIGTVVMLEYAGKITHNPDKEAFPLADYRVILLNSGDDYRMSGKPAEQYAFCQNGFLFIQSETDAQLVGPLVDYRNRGIPCAHAVPNSGVASGGEACSLPWFIRPQGCF